MKPSTSGGTTWRVRESSTGNTSLWPPVGRCSETVEAIQEVLGFGGE